MFYGTEAQLCKYRFNEVFDGPNNGSIEFDQNWVYGSRFDYAVHGEHAPFIPSGMVFTSVDNQNRKLLIIGSPVGNIIVFELYSPIEGGENGGLQYSVDLPKKISDIVGPHNILVDAETLFRILGTEKGAKDNIVNKLSFLFEDWKIWKE
jgi:hypothetical protein